jgi:hypothetical protein
MPYSTLHPKLAHLSDSQVEELISRYYGGEKLKGLVAKFGIDCTVSTLQKYLPAEISDQPCPNCGAVMEIPSPCRNLVCRNANVLSRCTQCIHGKHKICGCDFCITQRKANNIKQAEPKPIKEQIENGHPDRLPIQPEDLALTRGCYSISTNNGLLLYTAKLDKVPLAPTTELSDDLVNRLVEASLLSVCIQPSMDCELISGRLTTKNPKVTLQ